MSCTLNQLVLKLSRKFNTTQTIIKDLINSLKNEVKCCLKCNNTCDLVLLDETIKSNHLYRIFKSLNYCEKDLLVEYFCENNSQAKYYSISVYPVSGDIDMGRFECNVDGENVAATMWIYIINNGTEIIPAGTIFNLNWIEFNNIEASTGFIEPIGEEEDFSVLVSGSISNDLSTITIYGDFVPFDITTFDENHPFPNNSIIGLIITVSAITECQPPVLSITSPTINLIESAQGPHYILGPSDSIYQQVLEIGFVTDSTTGVCNTIDETAYLTVTIINNGETIPSGYCFNLSSNNAYNVNNVQYDDSVVNTYPEIGAGPITICANKNILNNETFSIILELSYPNRKPCFTSNQLQIFNSPTMIVINNIEYYNNSLNYNAPITQLP